MCSGGVPAGRVTNAVLPCADRGQRLCRIADSPPDAPVGEWASGPRSVERPPSECDDVTAAPVRCLARPSAADAFVGVLDERPGVPKRGGDLLATDVKDAVVGSVFEVQQVLEVPGCAPTVGDDLSK